MSDEFRTLPPPKPHETFGNLKTRRVKTTAEPKKRATKDLVQFNVKIPKKARSGIEAAFKVAADREPGLTKGEFICRMFEAFVSGGGTAAAGPSAADRAEGRIEAVLIYATPQLSSVLTKRSKALGWTIGATVEHACAVAKDAESKS